MFYFGGSVSLLPSIDKQCRSQGIPFFSLIQLQQANWVASGSGSKQIAASRVCSEMKIIILFLHKKRMFVSIVHVVIFRY